MKNKSGSTKKQHRRRIRRRTTRKGGSIPSLHSAVDQGDLSKVKSMVEQGADMNEVDKNGATPLMYAAQDGHMAIVRYLVEQGAVNDTPLILAAMMNHMNVVQYLVENGADLETYYMGYTALLAAVSKGHVEVVTYLVQHGADKEKAMNDDTTPLMLAARKGDMAIVQFLVENGADKNAVRKDGGNALIFAVINGNVSMIKYLVEQGMDVHYTTAEKGMTLLHLAAKYGNIEAVEFLVTHGVDTLLQNKNGDTAETLTNVEEIKQYLRKYPHETTVDRFIQAVDGKGEGDAKDVGDVLDKLVVYIRHAFEHGQQGAPAFMEHVQRICDHPKAKRVLAAALAKDPQFAGMDINEYCLRPVAAEAELYQEQLPRAKRTRSGPPSPPRADARPNPQPVITEHSGETVEIDGRPHYISFLSPHEAPMTARMSKRMRVGGGTKKKRSLSKK